MNKFNILVLYNNLNSKNSGNFYFDEHFRGLKVEDKSFDLCFTN